jgi:tRNA(Arg) A34 adenosine deaminase TadA
MVKELAMDSEDVIRYMEKAVEIAKKGIEKGQSPFGAIIVDKRSGSVVSSAHNTVVMDNDPTAHAEINAIRLASKKKKTWDLSGCAIFSTCEPCPMCFSAIHWANIDEIYYGATIEDAIRCGFREMTISNLKMKELGGKNVKVKIYSGVAREKCVGIMEKWMKNPNRKVY